MKKRVKLIGLSFMCIILLLSGCSTSTSPKTVVTGKKVYYFDSSRGELISDSIDEKLKALSNEKEKVQFIIDLLVANKSNQATALLVEEPIPIRSANISDRIVQVYLTNDYANLSAGKKMGVRAAIVYSLTELDFIDGVEFYIEDVPMYTATGQPLGIVYRNNFKMDILEPNPATMPYTLNLYFSNAEGQLVNEERYIHVSDTSTVEDYSKLIIEELVKGPKTEGLMATLPSDVKIKGITSGAGVCQLDLSFDLKSKFFTTQESKELMIYSIVNSLTELSNIKKVAFLIDGKSDIEWTPNIDFKDTFERSEGLNE